MQKSYIDFFQTGLKKLQKEMLAYPNEEYLWLAPKGIGNSAGNLTYHLLGNIDHFIGAALGATGYIRNRPEEFNIKNVASLDLINRIQHASALVENVISNLEDLSAPYPFEYFQQHGSIDHFLMKLLAHFNYHLGQINYHRRLLFPE